VNRLRPARDHRVNSGQQSCETTVRERLVRLETSDFTGMDELLARGLITRCMEPAARPERIGRVFYTGCMVDKQLQDMREVHEAAPISNLLENHRAFLRYLERRVGDRALAEDILQDAFTKVLARPEQAPGNEGVVPWFYRTLRNAAIDQFRRRASADRAVETFARELETHSEPATEVEAEICACVTRLAATLKPEYSDALRAIDVNGTPLKTFAEQHGISPSNAGVRVFRARKALKKRVRESCGTCAEHGCTNCTCRSGTPAQEERPSA